ncbi:MAG: ISKra4 family transposase, partial [Pyrinomonadaceae bacterium]|nr:ISKra4 family transposase [Pyrinomonadaceae bacterium]
MKFKIRILVENDDGNEILLAENIEFERGNSSLENLGLSLAESKELLRKTQQVMVREQVREFLKQSETCPHCRRKRLSKGSHRIVYRTLFGKMELSSPRLFYCRCELKKESAGTKTFSPLATALPERTSPEFLYLESKFSAQISFDLSRKLLAEVLPLHEEFNAATIRNHLHTIGERLEGELGEDKGMFIEGCPRDWANLPRPEMPLTVGIDGGYVHSNHPESRTEGWFEVIVGKSIKADGTAKCFGFVCGLDRKPRRRLFQVLQSQGMQMNQQITFLSDGGETVRNLQYYLNPQSEHLLDWFHITMRLTVMRQMARGLENTELKELILPMIESAKWFLWHGNIVSALEKVEDSWCYLDTEIPTIKELKLQKAVKEFQIYIENNAAMITNYGERYRNGEAIATGFVESAVNQIIAKRFVKKQQMRWTKRGAHLLLQVRVKVLNDELQANFSNWYP